MSDITDTKVKLTSTTSGSEYPVILGPTSITSGNSYEANYNSSVTVNASSQQLTLKQLKIKYSDDCAATLQANGYNGTATNNTPILKFQSLKANASGGTDYNVQLNGIITPTTSGSTYDYYATNRKYVDDRVGVIIRTWS